MSSGGVSNPLNLPCTPSKLRSWDSGEVCVQGADTLHTRYMPPPHGPPCSAVVPGPLPLRTTVTGLRASSCGHSPQREAGGWV